jgi:hypothetical protein
MDALRRTPRTTILAVGIVLLVVSSAFGYWLNVNEGDDKEVVAWIVVCIVASAILAGFLLRFVPATESEMDGNAPARRGLVLGFAAIVTCVLFWTTLPIVLGIPAVVLSAEGRARAATHGQGSEATAGLVLGAFAALATMVLFISGA